MKPRLNLFVLSVVLLSACTIEPEAINYGKDGCHFCKMTIVDGQHASEMVTKKGKSFKFDAIECLKSDLQTRDSSEVALILVADYDNPGILISAETATFLISPNIPSPMGAFLSAFSSSSGAEAAKAKNGGKLYNWTELKGTR